MITSQQVRAGRALVNWSQKELSSRSGVSLNAINNFEREIVAPRHDTLFSLRKTLEEAGLEFIGDSGVNKVTDKLRIEQYSENLMKTLLEDMGASVRSGITNFWLHGIEHADFPPELLSKWLDLSISSELDERVLLSYGNFNFLSRNPVYRWVSREILGELPFVVYGGNLALVIGDRPYSKLIIIRSRAIAKTFEDQFTIHWSGAKPPSMEQHIRGWEEIYRINWDQAA